MPTPKEKITHIVNYFGMSTEVQAKAMNVKPKTIYNKANDKIDSDKFTQTNYDKLVSYVKEAIELTDMKNKTKKQDENKVFNIADVMAMLPTEKEIDEWFTDRGANPPYSNIKSVKAIEGANKYRAIILQRLEKLKGN